MSKNSSKVFLETNKGTIFNADSLDIMRQMKDESIDLIMTSPPYALSSPKEYGNVVSSDYLDWFWTFSKEFKRILKPTGSLVIDIGGTWNKGVPTRNIYHFKLLIMLVEDLGLNLAQEFYWWNPSKLPSPAEWVNVRRLRAKDSINNIWWLSKSHWPKASNTRILQNYSEKMLKLLQNGSKSYVRPSGHEITSNFLTSNGGSIPSNLLAIANTDSKSYYHDMCRKKGLKAHPARFPYELPEFFIQFLTDEGDKVFDPFAGSCMTGYVAERMNRKWTCVEMEREYLKAATFRFHKESLEEKRSEDHIEYKIPKPGSFSRQLKNTKLDPLGGRIKKSKELTIL